MTSKTLKEEINNSLDHDFFYLENVEYKDFTEGETTHLDHIHIYTIRQRDEIFKFCTIDDIFSSSNVVWMTYPGMIPIKDDCQLYQKLEKVRVLEHNLFFEKRQKLRNNSLDFILTD